MDMKEQFIEYCINNKYTIADIRDHLSRLNNPELNKLLAKDFIKYKKLEYFQIEYKNDDNEKYEIMETTTFTIKEYTAIDYQSIKITEFISWYIKEVKYKEK